MREMAGAACHELAQPLATLGWLGELGAPWERRRPRAGIAGLGPGVAFGAMSQQISRLMNT